MQLAFREIGDPSAPAILLLHGGGVSGWMWDAIIPYLNDYYLLIPDMPGHGQSRQQPFSIDGSVQSLAELVKSKCGAGPVHLAGLSLGAQVGLRLLAEEPRLFQSAVLSGTLTRSLPGAGLVDVSARLYMPFRNLPGLVRANMKSLGVPESYFEIFAEETRALSAKTFSDITRANMSFSVPQNITDVSVPVLVVVGEKEAQVMHESSLDLLKALPNGRSVQARGAIHNWVFQFPQVFAHTLTAWFEGKALPEELQPLEE